MSGIILNNVIKPLIPYLIPPQVKSDIIDPLSIIIKLAIVSYKPVGTKISIGNNKLHIQNPSLFQGSLRTLYGDKKTDISMLQIPVVYACVRYLTGITSFYNTDMCTFRWLFEKAIKGLTILKVTYEGNEIVYTINQLIHTIQQFLDNNAQSITSLTSSDVEMKNAIFSNLNTIWDKESLQVVTVMFNKIDKCGEMASKKQYLIKTLEKFLSATDEDFAILYNYIFKR